jgi:hypothetical protein
MSSMALRPALVVGAAVVDEDRGDLGEFFLGE